MPIQPIQTDFKVEVVSLILSKKPEKALELLSHAYGLSVPTLKVGLPKGHTRNAYGTYCSKTRTICVFDSEILSNPSVILHEFYHHLRSRNVDRKHKGTEKMADKFALDFLQEYQLATTKAIQEKRQ